MASARPAAGLATLLLLLSLARPRAAAVLFSFYLPWDDDAETVIDLSGLLPKPAGRQGFVRATSEGQLATVRGGAAENERYANSQTALIFPIVSAA